MLVLGLDTTGADCSVALVDAGRVLVNIRDRIGRGHAEYLAPLVDTVLRDAGKSPDDIDRLAVCTGPGSFTGQRVALAFAKGFALPRKLPVIGLSSLELWARYRDPEQNRRIVSVADVRRGDLCWACYDHGDVRQPPVTQDIETARAAIRAARPDEIVEDAPIRADILAWLALDRSEADYPATPLYSRGPDAKLQGGVDP